MYEISALMEEYLARRTRDWLVKVEIDGVEYLNNKIVQFVVENNLSATDEFTLGTTVISKLTLQLKTTDEIPPNARVIPYVALQLPAALDGANVAWQDANIAWQDADFPWQGNVTEWLPLGEFYVDRRTQHKDVWTFECLDKLVFAAVPYVSQLTYPATMRAVWDEICDDLDYTYDTSVVIDPSYTIPAGPAGFTKLQVMGYIASANAACVYVAKDGTLRFRRFSVSDEPVVEIPPSEYIRFNQTNPVKTYTRIVAVYDEDGSAYEAGTGDENATLYIDLPWATQAIVNALYTRLNGFSYYPVNMDTRGSLPQMELGDRFRYGVKSAQQDLTWDTANVAWQDADWTWDGYEAGGGISLALSQTYTFKGGLKLSIDAPSISEQESEFGIDGSLTSQINNINRNAVKLGKAYFGLTITREDGLKIQREDGLSELTLNSDVMDWKVGGMSTLYYDALENELTFTGRLLAASGTFAGALEAATGTFSGELQGGTIEIGSGSSIFKADGDGIYLGAAAFEDAPFSVDLNGHLFATDAFIAGEIEAESGFIGGWTIETDRLSGDGMIEGGTIVGPFITTSLGSYPRISFSSSGDLLAAYSDEDNYIALNPSELGSPKYVFYAGGGVVGLLGESESDRILFITTASRHIEISAGNDLLLSAQGDVEITASDIFINGDVQFSEGATGSFDTADGKTVIVIGGLVTNII